MEIKEYIREHKNLENRIADLIKKEVQRFSEKTKIPITKINISVDYFNHIATIIKVDLNQKLRPFSN